MPAERYDVAVAGGGLTGLVAAACFARAGFEVLVVEGRERGAEGDGRVSALTVASERILRRLGAWEGITGAAPFRRMRVWEAGGGAEIRFDARAVGAEHLGHIRPEPGGRRGAGGGRGIARGRLDPAGAGVGARARAG